MIAGSGGHNRQMTPALPDNVRHLWSSARRQADEYRHGEDRPMGGYVKLASVYAAGTAGIVGLAKLRGKPVPALSAWDFAMMTLATQRMSRLVAKDPVTSPLRAPFARYEGTSGPGELAEEVRGEGLRHSVGELLSCPMCLSQWVATGFALGLMMAPAPTRLVMTTMAAIGGADILQHAYVALQQAAEEIGD
jgi:uncharacterized protein DUF1360